MPNFLQNIFEHLQRSQSRVVLREVHGEQCLSKTGVELLALVERARTWLRSTGIKPGELAAMLKDCQPRLVLTGNADLSDTLGQAWPELPPLAMLSDIFSADQSAPTLSRI